MRTTAISLLAAARLTFGGAGAVLGVEPSPTPRTTTPTTEPARDEGFPVGLVGLLGLAGLLGLMRRDRPTPVVTEREPSTPVR